MGNNQDKKLEAALHNARYTRVSPKLAKEFTDAANGKIEDLEDMVEITQFNLEDMTCHRSYHSLVNGRKILTAKFPPFDMSEMNDINDMLMRAQARDYFNEQAEEMVLLVN